MRAGPRPPRTEAARGSPRRCGHAAVSPARFACFGKQRCCGFCFFVKLTRQAAGTGRGAGRRPGLGGAPCLLQPRRARHVGREAAEGACAPAPGDSFHGGPRGWRLLGVLVLTTAPSASASRGPSVTWTPQEPGPFTPWSWPCPVTRSSAGSSIVPGTCSLSSGPPWWTQAAPTPSSGSGSRVLRVAGALDGVDHDKWPRLGSASGEVLGARGRAWGRGGCIGGRANVPGFPPVAGVWPRLRPSVPLQQFQVASRVPVKCGTFAPGRPLSRYANVNSPRLLYCPF